MKYWPTWWYLKSLKVSSVFSIPLSFWFSISGWILLPVFEFTDSFFHWISCCWNPPLIFRWNCCILQLCDLFGAFLYPLSLKIFTLLLHYSLTSMSTLRTIIFELFSGNSFMSLSLRSVSRVFYCFLLMCFSYFSFLWLYVFLRGNNPLLFSQAWVLGSRKLLWTSRCLLCSQWFLEVEYVRAISHPQGRISVNSQL